MRTAVSFGFRRSLGRHTGRVSATFLAAVLIGSAGTGPSAVASSRPGIVSASSAATFSEPGATAGLQPSIQFEEAESHRHDKIDFAPGGRVTVAFTPRHGDQWKVGGVEPAALPAGRLDGRKMRAQANGPDRAVVPAAGASIDLPNAEPATTVLADGASWHPATDTKAATTVEPEATISASGLRREIFGFLPYWQVNSSTLRLDYSKISTIAYFGVGADAAGNLQKKNADGSTTVGWSGWTSSKMTSIISTAHTNHTRVVLTVQSFGWNTSGLDRQKVLLGSSTSRLNLARQIAAAVRDRGADGVNLDIEPLASGYDTQFTALVRSVRAELDKIHTGYQLTFDTTGWIGNYPIENATATGGADAIYIMGYDYRGATSSPVGSVAPLDRTAYDIRETVAAYAARVPASKLILGVPYYGRAWSTATDLLNASNTSNSKYGASTAVIYSTAADYLAQYGRRFDSLERVAWTAYQRENCTTTYGCVTSWRQLYIDDAVALKAKYDLVNAYGLRGAGIWALGYDGTRTELWQAIKDKFVTVDTTSPTIAATATPALFSPNGDGAFETSRLAWTSSEPITGTARIYHGTTLIRSWTISKVAAGGVTWNGTNASGIPVGDGTYTYRITGKDAAGNPATSSVRVVVDRTLSWLRWSSSLFFPQDGDLLARTSRASFRLSRAATVSIGIYHGTTNVRTIWTNRALAAGKHGWTWDGRNAAGVLVPRGHYAMRVVATTSLGVSILNRTVIADGFAVTLSASTVSAGQTLTVTVKTAEPLSANPTIRFSQTGKTAVTKKTTSLGGGRYRVSFTVLAGGSGPAAIRVIGHDTSGGINASYATVAVQ
jgi:spore germination protein YaaH/flagellar hook assembly protein FlgD